MVKTAINVLVIYGLIVTVMYLAQRRLQYFPSRDLADAAAIGLSGVQQLSLKTADGETIVAWFARPGAAKPIILFFHGNAGSIADRANRMHYYQQAGYGALFVSYRGYGGSTGSPTEQGLIADGLTAYDWLIGKGVSAQNIVVIGESLGSGVAVQLAAKREVAAIALEAPFSSATDVAASAYWWLPARLLLKDRFESASVIGRISAPLFITHGTADRVVPYKFGRRLFDAANEPKRFKDVEGVGHEAMFQESVWQAELRFFDEMLNQKMLGAS